MFGIGGFELFLILLFGFLIFGPDKLPEIAKTVGKAIAKFRGAQESMTEQLKDVTFVDKDSDNPIKNPLDVIAGAAEKPKASTGAKKSAKPKEGSTASEKDAASAPAVRSESFAERKAAYDRERAKRKSAQAQAKKEQEEQAQAQAAAKKEAQDNPKIDIATKSVQEEGE